MARKYIIQDGDMRMGDVEMHYQLTDKTNPKHTLGGGYWYIPDDRKVLYLYGKSIDFGDLTIEQLKEIKTSGNHSRALINLEWRFSKSDYLTEAMDPKLNILI